MGPRIRRLTISFACADSFAAAIAPRARLEVVEGTFNIKSQGATLVVGESTPQPALTAAGVDVPSGSFVSLGPVQTVGAGWRLDQTFFRNTTAGSNSTVVFVGTVRDVEGVPEGRA